jgi:hypothetical protein
MNRLARNLRRASLSFGVVLAAAACSSSPSQGSSPADGGSSGAADAGGSTLSCLQIFDCARPCTEGDTACEEGCLGQGSAAARTATNALVDCFAKNGCAVAACISANCATELEACIDQSMPVASAPPSTEAPPVGEIPASVVGTWGHTSYGTFRRYTFGADGTATWEHGTTSVAGCPVTYATTQKGTATFSETTFTFHGGTASTSRFECGQKSEVAEPARTWTSQWQLEPTGLRVIDRADCEYTDESSIAFYCLYILQRE